jgi:hypothetical protein
MQGLACAHNSSQTMSEDWSCLLPKDDNELLVELTRAFLSYLGMG